MYMSAFNIEKIDYVVSGLPFTSLNPAVSSRILRNVKDCLKDGKFITFQYSLVRKSFIQKYFEDISHEKYGLICHPLMC